MSRVLDAKQADPEVATLDRLGELCAVAPIPEIEAEIERLGTEGPEAKLHSRWLLAGLQTRRCEYSVASATLIRLLRDVGTRPEFSYRLRRDLCNVFLWAGRPDRAERLIRKTLATTDFERCGWRSHGLLLNDLGRLYRRRGALSMASDVYRASLMHNPVGSLGWFRVGANLLHAELRADHLDRVEALLTMMAGAEHPPGEWNSRFMESTSWLSYLVELGRTEECEPHLANLRTCVGADKDTRYYQLLQNYEADVDLLRGAVREAATRYEAGLASSLRAHAHSDLAPSFARGLAESLLRLDDLAGAEANAVMAIRLGASGDRLEELIAYRILGECLWAGGRLAEARNHLQRAAALHAGLEFVRERTRLQQTMRRIAIPTPDHAYAVAGPKTEAGRERQVPPTRFPLKDGREFWAFDPRLADQIRGAAASRIPVLIEGETGTGKELVARLLHELGPNAAGPFIVADCSTLPDSLVEAELFGAARGAFTGCSETRDGIVARANRGTLFLDEIPELSIAAQGKLLRLLQEGTFRRVGDSDVRHVETRFIGATNRSVEDLLAARALKLDLFHRLNGHRIRLRPLRERREEIGPMARLILERSGHTGLTDAAVRHLERHDWPGNFRELQMLLLVLGAELRSGEALDLDLLAEHLPGADGTTAGPLRLRRIEGERRTLSEVLRQHSGKVTAAARSLGISRQAFYKALKRTGGRDGI